MRALFFLSVCEFTASKHFLLERWAVGFLNSRFIGLPNCLNCRVASHLALVEVYWLNETTSFIKVSFIQEGIQILPQRNRFLLFACKAVRKVPQIRSMCLTGTLDTDLTSTLTSRSSRPLVDFLFREMGKKWRKHEEKKVGETEGKKLPQIFWGPVTFNQSIERTVSATWRPAWMLANVSVWQRTHQSSINS